MKKVAIVVCNYNRKEAVISCIRCILKQDYKDFTIYVVDNASTDGSAAAIREEFGGDINLIENSINLGGSGGFNTGLKTAYLQHYEYLMCVDNDAMLDEAAVGELVKFLDSHPETGMAASKVYHLESPEHIQQYGQRIDFQNFCTDVPDLNRLDDGTMPDFRYVDSVAACALMVRSAAVEKIGFMPEENFLYWDDTEWCYRCNLAGMKVASVGTSKVYHAMGAKKEDITTFPTYYAWRNWIRFFAKYTPRERLEKLAESVLGSVFYEVYSGLHRKEYNRMKTVTFACEDAICGVTGRAKENRIMAVDHNYRPFVEMFASGSSFYIEENGYPAYAGWLKTLPEMLGIKGIIWKDEPGPGTRTISLCSEIFGIEDMSLKKIYIDIDGCMFKTVEDGLDIINFNYSKRTYIASRKDIFLEKINLYNITKNA